MHRPTRARRALTIFLACTALLFAATATAWAGDEDPDLEPVTVVKSEGTKTVRLVMGENGEFVLEPEGAHPPMRVMLKKGGEAGEVRVLEMKDGKWVSGGEPAHVEHEVFVHRGPATTTSFGLGSEGRNPMGTVLRWLMTDGMAGGLPNDPLKRWFEGGADVPMAGLRDALKAEGWTAQSLQGWFLQHLMGGMAALHAQVQAPAPHAMHPPMRGRWYEIGRGGGSHCDLCDGDRGHRMQRGHRGNFRHGRRHGRGQGRGFGRWHAQRGGCDCDQQRGASRGCRGDCGSCDKRGSCGSSKGSCGSCDKRGSCGSSKGGCGSCDKRGSCGSSKGSCGSCDKRGSCGSSKGDCGSCDKRGSCGSAQGKRGACGGDCGQKGRGPARRQAYMLWNDGSGWQHRKVDAQGPVAHWGHVHDAPEGMVFRGEDSNTPPELRHVIQELIGDDSSAPGSARFVVENLDLLPQDLLEHVPPSVLEGVLKELQGLGLGELLAPTKPSCDDCPKKGECKGGDCDKSATKKAGSCCGTCKGECKDCPKAQDGSCAGNCEDCPNKKGAAKSEKKDCCGTCQGGAAK